MKRILAFSFFPAFTPPSNGGESRLFNFYKSLSKFHRVTLLTSSHLDSNEETILHGSNFIERRIPKDAHFVAKWDELVPYSSGGDLSAAAIAASGKLPTLLHQAYLAEYGDADIIIHDAPFTVDYDLFLRADNKIRVYNAYNCETRLYEALHPDPKSRPIWDLVRDAEIGLLDGCDVVLYCNPDDLEDFKTLAPNSSYTAISAPNGMSPLSDAVRHLDKSKIDSVVFIGSGHPPNVEAALQITENIAPDIPDVKVHILGNCLPKGRYPKNVIRHGFVDDETKTSLIHTADLAINPMGAGSGSNVKVFDFFSYGIPVLSSQFGMRGIDAKAGQHCLIAPVGEFSKTIKSWSSRYGELQQIGLNGQEFAVRHYSWDVIAEEVSDKLAAVTKNGGWSGRFVLMLNDYDSFKDTGGGGVRTRGICEAINAWCPVVFVCFSDGDKLTVRHENQNTVVFSVPKTREHTEELENLNASFHVSVNDIIAHRQCLSNEVLVDLYTTLKQHCRAIVVEHPYMARLPISFGDRFVYSSQNNETSIKRRLLQRHPLSAELVRTVETLERATVECASAVIAVSQEDAESFSKGVRSTGPLVVVPNGAHDPAPPGPGELEAAGVTVRGKNTAVFVGSAHMPNVEAVKFIVETLAPSFPPIEFHIVGSVCNSFAERAAKNVHFWGVLSEKMKSAVMQSCQIGINPVTTGGGSNIKLADFFANGLYVLTTPFGLRGYPEGVSEHSLSAELVDFSSALDDAFRNVLNEDAGARSKRRKFFDENLSMVTKAQDVVTLLKRLEAPKKKVLFVTYRYTDPPLGGAESHLGNLLEALDNTDAFQIDVVSTELSKMENLSRFSEEYSFDETTGAKIGLRNVRFARFPCDARPDVMKKLTAAWLAQPLVEKAVYEKLNIQYESSGLAWGWGSPEQGRGSTKTRWAFTSCGIHLHKKSRIHMKCHTPGAIGIWIRNTQGELIHSLKANSQFDLDFSASRGNIEITTSSPALGDIDPRPLAFHVSEMRFDGRPFDLGQPLLPETASNAAATRFDVLAEACSEVRDPLSVNLTEMRGPFSSELEAFLENNVHKYDLVVTHNHIFRPAVIAVETANKVGVPVISIPHAHLDDDFYHFTDVHKCVINSDLVLAAPKAACDFYKAKGANVAYHAPGIDARETFSADDIAAFKKVCSVEHPFFFVLGRKSRAKGYQKIIEVIEQLNRDEDIHLVMIGPDDDNLPVSSACVSYLGSQPREVVRGALMSCVALVNMSYSESFGIVLLEAWLAGKPVIVNGSCAAFHDLATNNRNALVVDDAVSLREGIKRLVSDQELCDRLAENGKGLLEEYEWSNIGSVFVESCRTLINERVSKSVHHAQ